jgi:hypothetical protein
MLSVRRWPADRPRIAASITGAIVASASFGTFGCTGCMADPVRIRFVQAPQLCHEWRRNKTVRSIARRIAHGDSGYPVLTILDPFLSPRRLPQQRPIYVRQPLSPMWGHPRRPGRGRTGSVSWGRDRTPHNHSRVGPTRCRWQDVACNALSAVGWPTF